VRALLTVAWDRDADVVVPSAVLAELGQGLVLLDAQDEVGERAQGRLELHEVALEVPAIDVLGPQLTGASCPRPRRCPRS